jgi:RND family efflux transporter MFP subunit
LGQYNETRYADGTDGGARRFLARAPISGIISESRAVSGMNVEIGTVLYRIVDTSMLYVSGLVPESELSKLRELSGAEIEVPESAQTRPVSQLVTIGQLVDSATRTVPVTYAVENRDHRFAVHQTVFLRLLLKSAGKRPVVPESAIIDDAGRPVVFVQKGGETFQRRPVKLGARNGGLVQVLDGIDVGDRVVTKGAYLIRLSTMSNAVPAHGHVH